MTDAVEVVAKAMALANGSKWDALDFNETPNGSDPEEERDYWRHCARIAISAVRPFILEEAREIADKATGGLRPVSGEWSREQLEYWTCGVIDGAAFVDAALCAAKET